MSFRDKTTKAKEKAASLGACACRLWKKYDLLVYALAFLAVAILLRVPLFDHVSGDYTYFLKGWYEEIAAQSGAAKLASPVGNYTVAYKYLIALMTCFPGNPLHQYKIVSVVFDVIQAVFVGLVLLRVTKSSTRALIGYAAALLLPNVFLNSAAWAQCDGIFTCFLVISLYCLLCERPNLAMAALALSFCFKIQAIFFAPVVVVLFLRGKIRWTGIPVFAGTYVAVALPAVFCGMPFGKALFGAYVDQIGYYNKLTMNAPNFYQIFKADYVNEGLSTAMVWVSLGICAVLCILLYRRRYELTGKRLVLIAYLFAVVLPFFLPHMHERYFYVADIFGLLFALTEPKKCYIPIFTVWASLRGIVRFLYDPYNTRINFLYVALVMFVGIVLLCLYAVGELKEDLPAGKAPVPEKPEK